jgi:ribosomal protein L37AE/L43A
MQGHVPLAESCSAGEYLQQSMQQAMPRALKAALRGALRSVMPLWRAEGFDVDGLEATQLALSPRYRRRLATADAARACITLRADAGLWSKPLLQQVIVHELGHLVIHRRHGFDARPHGREWRRLMALSGLEHAARIPGGCGVPKNATPATRRPAHGTFPRPCYEHRCPVCQMVRVARRPVRQWLCRACVEAGLDGALLVSRVPRAR